MAHARNERAAKIKLCVVMCSIMKRRLRSLLSVLVVTLLLCSRKTEAQRKIIVLLNTCEILSLAAELAKNTNHVSIINLYVDLRVYILFCGYSFVYTCFISCINISYAILFVIKKGRGELIPDKCIVYRRKIFCDTINSPAAAA